MSSAGNAELLAPAGNPEKLEIAIHYGADAVYLGGKNFSLRNFSDNFTLEEIHEAIQYAHHRDVKVYVACNIFPRDDEIKAIREYLLELGRICPDAIIVADPGIMRMAHDVMPHIPLHLSTQANTTNIESVRFWEKHGVARINLARELSLAEIRKIVDNSHIEIECFVHGAMCISYSGRCLLSNYLAKRDSNRGMCCQPCRWKYAVVEKTRPGEYFPAGEDARGTYLFNSKDLCMIDYIPEMIQAGIVSFKIEGRMKGIHYVATTVKTYREALDSYFKNPSGYTVSSFWKKQLSLVSYRDFCTGFYLNDPDSLMPYYENDRRKNQQSFFGKVTAIDAKNRVLVDIRNKICIGESIEILKPEGPPLKSTVLKIHSAQGESLDVAQPGMRVSLKISVKCQPNDLIRRSEN
jgi:putative protease